MRQTVLVFLLFVLSFDGSAVELGPCDLEQHGTAYYGGECAHVTVSSGLKPEGRAASLNIMRVRARSTPLKDPLVIITGGPGTSAVSQAWQYLPFFRSIQKERDILFVDQRGTGKSQPLYCEKSHRLNSQHASSPITEQFKAELLKCLENYPFLSELSTQQAARDLESVRQALNYEQLNLWGSSYGTRVALAYQQAFPMRARTVVLDGTAPAIMALPRNAEHDARLALQNLFDACLAQISCKSTFGDLKEKWAQLIVKLNNNPLSIELKHPRTGELETLEVTSALVANWVRFALYSRELSAILPLAIQRATQLDFNALSNLAFTAQDGLKGHFAQGMHIAILCREDHNAPHLSPPNPYSEYLPDALPPMPFLELGDLSDVCQKTEDMPPEDAPSFIPAKSQVPTLLLSGELDPATPPYWADWTAQDLSDHKHWVVTGGHHGVTGLGCIPSQIALFVESGGLHTLDDECFKKVPVTAFFTSNAGPSLGHSTTGVDAQKERAQ